MESKTLLFWILIICAIIVFGGVLFVFQNIARKREKANQKANEEKARLAAMRKEQTRKQHEQWMSEVHQKATDIEKHINGDYAYHRSPLPSMSFKSSLQLEKIVTELSEIAKTQGAVDYLAEELSKKGGTST